MATRTENPWEPQPGPQRALMECPVSEIFYGGARGGGKTAGLLGHFLLYQERYGKHARGILFRRTYPEFEEVQRQAVELFPLLGAVWRTSRRTWIFPSGAVLLLRYCDRDDHAMHYQGHSYTWMAFDELTNWPEAGAVDRLRACLRASEKEAKGMPKFFLASGNPGGIGHQWVKERFITPCRGGNKPFTDAATGIERIFIPAYLEDNLALVENDPGYLDRLRASGPPWLVDAWLRGNWDIVPGAFLEGFWEPDVHVVSPFPIPPTWKRWRAMDWGSARPYSVGWYAMDYEGVIYRYRELYGDGGKSNVGTRETADTVAVKINGFEKHELMLGLKFSHNPADTEIWSTRGHGLVINDHFRAQGIMWTAADKGAGSRINGAHEVMARLRSRQFFVFETCRHFVRTVPVLVADEHNIEDVDTQQEDHVWDELRYSLMSRRRKPEVRKRAPSINPRSFDSVTNPPRVRDVLHGIVQ